MNYITKLAVCTLNQWAMDFEHNMKQIVQSIVIAKVNQHLLTLTRSKNARTDWDQNWKSAATAAKTTSSKETP